MGTKDKTIEELNKYDRALNECFVTLHCIGREDKTLHLTNFDIKDKGHLTLLQVARILYYSMDYKIEVDMNPFKYYFYRITGKLESWLKRGKQGKKFDCQNFVRWYEIDKDCHGIFKDIYDSYYGGME